MNQTQVSTAAEVRNPPRTCFLDFEKPLFDLEAQIADLQRQQEMKSVDYSYHIQQLRLTLLKMTTEIYQNLSAWDTVQVARHPRRPLLGDYIDLIVNDFRQLHGDRRFGDDPAIITGLGRIGRDKIMLIGHNKGKNLKEKTACNFGCAHPEGYSKALQKMKLAEKFHLPIVCLIDTPGAYPGIGAEERGQARTIALNLMEMSRLHVPMIGVVIGEGGSGGALGIGVTDRLAMLQYSYFSVISPEGCAAILWKNAEQAPQAAEALKLTSKDILRLGVIDAIIPEPLGGAHRNPYGAIRSVEEYLSQTLRALKRGKIENLRENRYQKIRRIGQLQIRPKTP